MKEKGEYLICKNGDIINVNNIIEKTQSEGPGKRFCIWVQGCLRHCRGCFATDTWDFAPRNLYEVKELVHMIQNQKEIEGVTILGGEPFAQAESLAELVTEIHKLGLTILLFTGYKYCEIKTSDNADWHKIIENIDVLIDGEYIESKKNFGMPLIGSSNQNIYFLTSKYCMDDFKKNTIEIRIRKSGEVHLNGMGDFDYIKKIILRSSHGF